MKKRIKKKKRKEKPLQLLKISQISVRHTAH